MLYMLISPVPDLEKGIRLQNMWDEVGVGEMGVKRGWDVVSFNKLSLDCTTSPKR